MPILTNHSVSLKTPHTTCVRISDKKVVIEQDHPASFPYGGGVAYLQIHLDHWRAFVEEVNALIALEAGK